jgi:hypothetical protein
VALLTARAASGVCAPELAEEIPDVVLSAEIRGQAATLGFDPVRIYEFVRNEFEFQPYYGSMRGPEETLRAKQGNEYDLSALLVSLLRVSEDTEASDRNAPPNRSSIGSSIATATRSSASTRTLRIRPGSPG